MMNKTITVRGVKDGVMFDVVMEGDRVTFFDTRLKGTQDWPNGRLVASYDKETILTVGKGCGLDLVSYVASWKIPASEMEKIKDELTGSRNENEN